MYKYLQAASVSQKGNFTWAGQVIEIIIIIILFNLSLLSQTFGDSDGRLEGTQSIQTISCSPPGTCTIPVPAPTAALVFLSASSSALTENSGSASHTFPTTVLTETVGTATNNPSVLATLNGHTGMDSPDELDSTSKGGFSGGG